MKNRLLCLFSMATLGLACTLGAAPAQAQTQAKTLRIVPHADLKVLDPTFTTAYITRNFGYMVYDTLFAMDTHSKPQPQMVEKYEASADKKTWTFTLRPGLKFSDGQALTTADVIASLERWSARDNIGQAITRAGGKWEAQDDSRFTLTLTQPFDLVLDGLAKVSSYPAFILPKRLASQPATRPLTEVVGSGPYMFKRDEWVPGSKIVFERNPNYIGPKAPADGLAGDKTPHIARVEWRVLPDSNSATAALTNGEVDMIEQAPADYIDALRANKNVKIGVLERAQGYIVLNQSMPPFDNPKARQAIAHLIDQDKFTAAMGYPDDLRMKYCATVFICGGPNDSTAGAAPYAKPDPALAKKLLAEAGYKGEKLAILLPTDLAYLNSATLVAIQALQDIGVNLDIQSMDWATLTARRARKAPLDKGGWNIFLSAASEFNVDSPLSNTYLGAVCGNSLPGWPCDKKLDELRQQWISATTSDERKRVLDLFQERVYEVFPVISIGQYSRAFAAHNSLKNTDKIWSLPNLWVLDK
ncbi:ABC transporter substrate-binding protein [Achromobacter spanius]|uniref:ABC transporter substrate-binding protein n=1 Tax=Achromobacter spanius TaxID=217203 RepID=UPI000F8FAD52|nr:ABC transporter substrate-binding protein [Achromobacter spanius]AZS77235.1 ABC transporter substrate-binding protein [Achromobacter spanius]